MAQCSCASDGGIPVSDRVVIKREKTGQVKARHPWVDAGMLKRVSGPGQTGTAVRLSGEDGAFLAYGLWAGDDRFPVRLVSWDPEDTPGPGLFVRLALESAGRRAALPLAGTTSYRVVFGEADGLPGLVADRHGDYVILLLECPALRLYLPQIASALHERLCTGGVLLRAEDGPQLLAGTMPPLDRVAQASSPAYAQAASTGRDAGATGLRGRVRIAEPPLEFDVDVLTGQKTGWFCDQRENRRAAARYAAGRTVLDVFCYTGGFSVAALRAGAESACLVDSSAAALALAERNLDLAGSLGRATVVREDAFDALRRLGREGQQFGMVIVDPPKLLSPGAERPAAEKAYLRLQALAMRLVEPDGLLVTFSCSGAMDRTRFDAIVAEAAGTRACRILERLGQPADHPVSMSFRKSEYLKGLILQMG